MEIALSFFTALFATFVFLKLGIKLNLVDRPSGKLKPHEKPIPFTGGTAVIVAMIPWFFSEWKLLLPVAALWLIGLMDDIKGISPLLRLFAELITGFAGAYYVFGHSLFLSLFLAVVFAAVINAYNMIDGMDGICGGVTAVSGLLLSFVKGYENIGRVMAGAYSGFLVFNFPPAKIFLGDEGSYIAGSIMGLALIGSFGSPNFVKILAISWLPLLDLAAGFIRRILAGISPMKGDRDHFYDKLFVMTGKRKKVTFFLALLMTFIYGALGMVSSNNLMILLILAFLSIIQILSLKSLTSTT